MTLDSNNLRLEVEVEPTGLVNLIQNPDGELGSWGWETPLSNSAVRSATVPSQRLSYQRGAGTSYFHSEPMPVNGGWYVMGSVRIYESIPPIGGATASAVRCRWQYLDSNKALLSQGSQTALTATTPTVPLYINTVQLPAGTEYLRLRFDVYKTNGTTPTGLHGVGFNQVSVASAATTAELSQFASGLQPVPYENILGKTYELSVERKAFDVGLINAGIKDAMLDPAVSETIRPGKRVRVRAYSNGAWHSLAEGKVTAANVQYVGDPTLGKVSTNISLSASDGLTALANLGESRGIKDVADLPLLLEGKGVPWAINGSGNQIFHEPRVISYNENASLLDQIEVTRQTNHGYAWIARNGVLNVEDRAYFLSLPASDWELTDEATGSGQVSYLADIDVDFDMQACINHVTVKWLRYNIGTASTEEITYGPYVDQDSIDLWGARSAEFTIQGNPEDETPTNIAAFAQVVLDENSTPAVKVNSLTMPVRNTDEVSAAIDLDLCTKTQVTYADKVDGTYAVTAIKHTITPQEWNVDYEFGHPESVEVPAYVPAPPFTGVSMGTAQAGFVQMYAGQVSSIPTGWLLCDGSTFDGNQYPELAERLGDTFGTHVGTLYYLPDMRTRFPRGANPAVGVVGGSDTVTMPEHQHSAAGLSTGTPQQTPNTWNTPNTGGNGTISVPSHNQHTHNVTGTTGNVVSNPAISNVPKYVTLNYIIKV